MYSNGYTGKWKIMLILAIKWLAHTTLDSYISGYAIYWLKTEGV